MREAQERGLELVVPGGAAAELFELPDQAFDLVAVPVSTGVKGPGTHQVDFVGNDRFMSRSIKFARGGIEALIGDYLIDPFQAGPGGAREVVVIIGSMPQRNRFLAAEQIPEHDSLLASKC